MRVPGGNTFQMSPSVSVYVHVALENGVTSLRDVCSSDVRRLSHSYRFDRVSKACDAKPFCFAVNQIKRVSGFLPHVPG